MHATSSYSTSADSTDNGGPFPGFEMAYGDNLWYWKHARVGWELGFGLLPITIKDDSTLPATVNQTLTVSAPPAFIFSRRSLPGWPQRKQRANSSFADHNPTARRRRNRRRHTPVGRDALHPAPRSFVLLGFDGRFWHVLGSWRAMGIVTAIINTTRPSRPVASAPKISGRLEPPI